MRKSHENPSDSKFNKFMTAGLSLVIAATALTGCSRSSEAQQPDELPQSTISQVEQNTQPEETFDPIEYPTPTLPENIDQIMDEWGSFDFEQKLEIYLNIVALNHPEEYDTIYNECSMNDSETIAKKFALGWNTLYNIYNMEGAAGEEIVKELLDVAAGDPPKSNPNLNSEEKVIEDILLHLKGEKSFLTNKGCKNKDGACSKALSDSLSDVEEVKYASEIKDEHTDKGIATFYQHYIIKEEDSGDLTGLGVEDGYVSAVVQLRGGKTGISQTRGIPAVISIENFANKPGAGGSMVKKIDGSFTEARNLADFSISSSK